MRHGIGGAAAPALVLATALGLASALGVAPAIARAQQAGESKPQEGGKGEAKRGGSVDQITGRRLNAALEALKDEKYAAAREELGKLNPAQLSPYEVSRVEQLLASIDQSESKYTSARGHLEKALASGGLNETETQAVRFQIAQLFVADEKWRDAIRTLNEWFATAQNPNSAAYYLLAIAYYQIEDFQNALAPATKAIELAEKPQENWLQLLLALRIERQEYKLAAPILQRLLEIAPGNKSYWVQLSSVYSALGDYPAAVQPMQLAYHLGLLTEESDLRRLAELLVQVNIPYRAATVMTKALEAKQAKEDAKNFEFLGNCWIQAREFKRAIAPLERAAGMAETGDVYVRLAEVHVQAEDWQAAAAALGRGLSKGQLKNPGSAQLLLGIALYSQEKRDQARSAFEEARRHVSSRSQAEGWLKQIAMEAKRG